MFLKAKHWQLFIIMLGIPIIYQFYFIAQVWMPQGNPVESHDGNGFSEVLNEPFVQLDVFPLAMIFFSLIFFAWLWSIAIGLQKSIPTEIKMKVNKFKIFFFIPVTYITLLMVYVNQLYSGIGLPVFFNGGWVIGIILPLHLFSMFCIFYTMYFVAKTIKTAELQRATGFSDFAAEFFLLWFYYIGIWFIQPKVNKLYNMGKFN